MRKKRIIVTALTVVLLLTLTAISCGMTDKKDMAFEDVNQNDWYYQDVEFVKNNDIMQGTGEKTFSPNNTTSRAMIITVLWRIDGEKDVNSFVSFEDVKKEDYFYKAVAWASREGVAKGYSDERFAPNEEITREQLATFFYRYAEYKKFDTSRDVIPDTFDDKSEISSYAKDAMEWAIAKKIISGTSERELSPKEGANRSQLAAIVNRFFEKFIRQEEKIPTSGNVTVGGSSTKPSKNENSDKFELKVSSMSVNAGEEAKVYIEIKNNPGVLGMILKLEYDEEVLKLESVENGNAVSDVLELTSSKGLKSGSRFVWDGLEISEDDIKDGEILCLNFKTSVNAKAGKYKVLATYDEGDIIDNNLLSVSPAITDGSIEIK